MTEADHPRRGRGRPRTGSPDKRRTIERAALEEFALHGYEATTVRGIGARAGVDPALVHHYFGSKADLFAALLPGAVRPDRDIARILEGPEDGTGERIVRAILASWDHPDHGSRAVIGFRKVLGEPSTASLVAGFLRVELLGPVAAAVAGEAEAPLRAALASSQIAGLIVTRYLLGLPTIAAASPETLARHIGATVQHYLFGHLAE